MNVFSIKNNLPAVILALAILPAQIYAQTGSTRTAGIGWTGSGIHNHTSNSQGGILPQLGVDGAGSFRGYNTLPVSSGTLKYGTNFYLRFPHQIAYQGYNAKHSTSGWTAESAAPSYLARFFGDNHLYPAGSYMVSVSSPGSAGVIGDRLETALFIQPGTTIYTGGNDWQNGPKIGVKTSTPAASLDVAGDLRARMLSLGDFNAPANSSATLIDMFGITDPKIVFRASNASFFGQTGWSTKEAGPAFVEANFLDSNIYPAGTYMVLIASAQPAGTDINTKLQPVIFATPGGTGSPNVGIGKLPDPNYLVDIGGSINASGMTINGVAVSTGGGGGGGGDASLASTQTWTGENTFANSLRAINDTIPPFAVGDPTSGSAAGGIINMGGISGALAWIAINQQVNDTIDGFRRSQPGGGAVFFVDTSEGLNGGNFDIMRSTGGADLETLQGSADYNWLSYRSSCTTCGGGWGKLQIGGNAFGPTGADMIVNGTFAARQNDIAIERMTASGSGNVDIQCNSEREIMACYCMPTGASNRLINCAQSQHHCAGESDTGTTLVNAVCGRVK